MEDSNPELESFRQQWRAEVSARSKPEGHKFAPSSADPSSSRAPRRPPAAPRIAADKIPATEEEAEDHVEPRTFGDEDASAGGVERGVGAAESSRATGTEPRSALEHYEKAVEKESQGSLGDSLDLYRKAFKVRAPVLAISARH